LLKLIYTHGKTKRMVNTIRETQFEQQIQSNATYLVFGTHPRMNISSHTYTQLVGSSFNTVPRVRSLHDI